MKLLVLDFHGVCSYSTAELVAGAINPGSITDSIRPEVEGLIADAQIAGLQVAVLSNELSRDWIPDVPLLGAVDHVVCCSDNGIYKPDRRAFQRCALLAGVATEHTAVVDDHPDNVAVAASLGMASILFETSTDDPWKPVRELFND